MLDRLATASPDLVHRIRMLDSKTKREVAIAAAEYALEQVSLTDAPVQEAIAALKAGSLDDSILRKLMLRLAEKLDEQQLDLQDRVEAGTAHADEQLAAFARACAAQALYFAMDPDPDTAALEATYEALMTSGDEGAVRRLIPASPVVPSVGPVVSRQIRTPWDAGTRVSDSTNLRVLKPSRKKLRPGDIFAMQLPDDLYLFGRVVRVAMGSDAAPMPGANLVYIYRDRSSLKEPTIGALTPDRLLFGPVFINRLGWSRGYFETVAHADPIPGDELEQHCFLDFTGKYFDIGWRELPGPIEPCGDWGLANYHYIDKQVSAALGYLQATG